MKQDRRFNGLVFVGSLTQTLFSFAVVVAGIALAVLAFTHFEMVNNVDDLQFFINQQYINKLKPEFAYLFTGAGIGLIGLIFFVSGVTNIVHVRRYKVSQHRLGIVFGCLLVLVMLAGVDTYLYLQINDLTRNIKYIIYGINVLFSFAVLFNLLGVALGRNESFVSNDNNKFAYVSAKELESVQNLDNQNVIANNVSEFKAPLNPVLHQNIPNKVSGTNSNMPITMQGGVGHLYAQGHYNNLNTIHKTAPVKGVQTGENLQSIRPINNIGDKPNSISKKFCPKCGKLINNGEVNCSLCGYKIGE